MDAALSSASRDFARAHAHELEEGVVKSVKQGAVGFITSSREFARAHAHDDAGAGDAISSAVHAAKQGAGDLYGRAGRGGEEGGGDIYRARRPVSPVDGGGAGAGGGGGGEGEWMHNTALFPASYIASASVISGAQPSSLPPHSGRGPAAASVSIRQHPSAYGDGAVEREGRGECREEAVRGRLMSQLAKLQRSVLQLELSSKASSKAS
jgi:hypothetical protein